MVTRAISHLAVDGSTFLNAVVKKKSPLLYLGYYLLPVVSGNRYLAGGNSRNTLSNTITENVDR